MLNRILIGLGLVIIGSIGSWFASDRNSLEAKARRDEVVTHHAEDPDYLAARAQGRATLDQFLGLARNPPANTRAFTLKVAVKDANGVEWFWVNDFKSSGNKFTGKINNDPKVVKSVVFGQTITFDRSEIGDWMYVSNGKIEGNFTACAMLKKQPPAEREKFVEKFGLECSA